MIVALASRSTNWARVFWDQYLRFPVYWLVLLVLLLEVWMGIDDHWQYLQDAETYQRVYGNVQLEQLSSHVFGVLAAVAMVFHLQGRRGRQFSPVTVGYFVLEVGFGIVSNIYDLNPICCT